MFTWKVGAKEKGWVALVPQGGRLDLAHVVRDPSARPEIRRLESFRIENGEADALQRLRTSHKLKSCRCTTVLGAGQYQFLQLEEPTVPAEERRQALRWRLKDIVDFPVDNASIDVLDIPAEGQAAGRPGGVFVAAAAGDVIAARMAVFAGAKLDLEAIDLPELAQRNVAALFEEANRGLAFLALDDQGGLLTFTYRGELYACRHIDVSASQLAQADPERRQQLLERLALELQRSLDTFDRQFGFISVARLMVACAPAVDDLAAGLAANLYLPVHAMDLSEVAEFPALPELRNPARQAQCLTAIGAALRDAQ